MSPVMLALAISLVMGVLAMFAGIGKHVSTSQRSYYDNPQVNLGGYEFSLGSSAIAGIITGLVCFFGNWILLYMQMPMQTIGGLWWLIVVNLVVVLVVVIATNFINDLASVGIAVVGASIILMAIAGTAFEVWTVKNNDAAQATVNTVNAVMIDKSNPGEIPNTDANHMVIVASKVAQSKASQSFSTGIAAQQALSTYFKLGVPTLQSVDGHMWYVFQLEFNDSRSKGLQHNTVPGYIMVDAEDPDADAVQRFGTDPNTGVNYTMAVSINGGQSEDVLRHVYENGYTKYNLVDPTLEIADNGHPYFTIAIQSPTEHWGYDVPVGLLVVDANNGDIKQYDLNQIPDWVDRVYSGSTAVDMMSWWGSFSQTPYGGNTQAKQYKVDETPQLVYTKDGHPAWRMLMTSFNSDTAVSYVVLFDARSNLAKIYQPQKAIGTEATALHTFQSTSNPGVKPSMTPTDLTLHMLYGRLTWVVSYITTNDSGGASFNGVGLLDAYDSTDGGRVAFGKSRSAALAAYQSILATSASGGNATENGNTSSTTGIIADRNEVVIDGKTYVYLTLAGDTNHVYSGQVTADTPELILSKVGDPVTITFLDLGDSSHVRNIGSFDDSKLQLNPVS